MIIVNPINVLLYLISTGIDITLFFLMVRLVLSYKSFRFLAAFDKAGEKLVNTTTETVSRFSIKLLHKELTERGRIAVAMMTLTLADLLLVWISVSLSN